MGGKNTDFTGVGQIIWVRIEPKSGWLVIYGNYL